jgi:hypothetical protein
MALMALTTSAAGPSSLALAVVGGAEIVDHHLGALTRQLERVLATDAAPCARDDDHATFADSTHVLALSFKRKSAVTRGR